MTNRSFFARALWLSALLLGAYAAVPAYAAKIDAATAERLAQKVAAGEPVRLIIKLKGESVPPAAGHATRSAIESAIAARQLSLSARHPGLSGAVKRYRHAPFLAVEANALGLSSILNDEAVESVEEDLPLYLNLTQTAAITKSDLAWSSGYRGAGQTIAILDTGVDSSHPFLSGKVVNEACFSAGGSNSTSLCPNGADRQTGPGSAAPCTDSGLGCYHGTHVAGIAAGKSGILTNASGMAPDANIIAIQVFTRYCEPGGACSLSAYTSDLGLALDYVYQLRATYAVAAVNMSLGGGAYSANCDSQSPSLKNLIDTLRAANIATVIAAGNNGSTDSISLPACISSAISVGATTKSNVVADYSNSSSLISLLAPGSSIYSSLPGGGYGYASGTSMATPHVSGIWALMKAAKPTASVSEILTALLSSGLSITDNRNGIVKPLIQLGGSAGAIATLTGLSNSPPIVTLTGPANGASFTAPANITVSASASDADGSVAKVEFYNGSTLIASDTNGSDGWGVTWSAVPAGSYALSAKAIDNAGSSATSAIANVAVGPASSADPSLVGHWQLDENSGLSASDASGYGHHGALINGPTWTSARQGNGVSLDGVDDYILVNHSNSLAIGNNDGDFTAAFFIRLRQGATGGWRSLMHKGLVNQDRTFGIWASNTDNRLVYQVSTSASWVESAASTAQLPLNQWVHVAYVKSANAIRLYLDGVLDSEKYLSGSAVANSGPLYIGKDPWHAGADSVMDDVRLYTRALSPAEIASLAGI